MALSISRKRGEAVQIGEAYVEVVEIYPGRVKLSISAPKDVPIRRNELPVRQEAAK